MKHICIIANGYPTKDNPEYAFIRPVAHGFVDNGIKCTVIAPQSITKIILGKRKTRPEQWEDKTLKGNFIRILQPKVFTFSLVKIKGNAISNWFIDTAIKHCIKKYNINADVFYGHFWECGMAAAKVCGEKPAYVACGESNIWVYDRYSKKQINKLLPNIRGVICVSTKNKEECTSLGLLKHNPKVIVLPNGIDRNEFYKIDRNDARNRLGIDLSYTIAIFVGAFIERKGVLRVVEAAKRIPDIKLILIGAGEQEPESDQIIFQGRIPHEEIVTYLNASDMFVLPTQAEGCCNAIIEAMACGLPIISSNLSFNDDILGIDNSIRIEPNDIGEISNAMFELYYNVEKRKIMEVNSMFKANKLSINNRVEEIISFVFEQE